MTPPRGLGPAWRFWSTAVCVAAMLAVVACGQAEAPPSWGAPDVFSPAPRTLRQALTEFLRIQPTAEQPIPFPHNTHVENQIGCTEYCHESATKGPIAGLPSVDTCLICHFVIATDQPIIQQITALQEKGLDLSWTRVNQYARQAHVRFNHAPHLRADIECSTCHGDMAQQTVAERNVDLDMGFCVTCHLSRNAPVECVTCHF